MTTTTAKKDDRAPLCDNRQTAPKAEQKFSVIIEFLMVSLPAGDNAGYYISK